MPRKPQASRGSRVIVRLSHKSFKKDGTHEPLTKSLCAKTSDGDVYEVDADHPPPANTIRITLTGGTKSSRKKTTSRPSGWEFRGPLTMYTKPTRKMLLTADGKRTANCEKVEELFAGSDLCTSSKWLPRAKLCHCDGCETDGEGDDSDSD